MEVRNKFLIDSEKSYGQKFVVVQKAAEKFIPKVWKIKKAKWLTDEALQIAGKKGK